MSSSRDGTDPFACLGLSPGFRVEDDQVESAYLMRVAAAHPDVAGDASADDAADLARARGILMDPEQRARALLSVLWARSGGASLNASGELPDGFLMEIMELRSEIEDSLAEDGSRERWEQLAQQRRSAHIDRVGELFDALPDPPTEERLAEIQTELNAWRYTERLIEQLDPGYDPGRADFSGPID